MEEDIKILEKKINKDYKDMMAVINSTSLPLFVEDTIEDMHILIEKLIARYKELKEDKNELQKYMKEYLIPKSTINLVYIPKSKVKEKIEELKQDLDNGIEKINQHKMSMSSTVMTNPIKIAVLQELLEES